MACEYIREYGFDFTDEMLASRVHNFTVRAQYPFTTEQLCTELDRLGIEYRRGKYVKRCTRNHEVRRIEYQRECIV